MKKRSNGGMTYDFAIEAADFIHTDVFGAEDGVGNDFQAGEEKVVFEGQYSRSGRIA